MQLAWLEGRLREVCVSDQQLRLRFGSATGPVKLVLTVLAQSDCLRDVRTHRCLQLLLIPPTTTHDGRLLIRHKEIDVTADLLTDHATTVFGAHDATSTWLDPVRRLRIVSISNNA